MTRDGFDLGFWPFTSAAFSPDGKRDRSRWQRAGTTGRAFMIDAETGKENARVFSPPTVAVTPVSFTPHGDTLLGAPSGEGYCGFAGCTNG